MRCATPVNDVKTVYNRLGRCIVAVSEGIRDEKGVEILKTLQKDLETDQHGNVQLSGTGALGDLLVKEVKEKLNIPRVRSDTFGYLQRSFMGCVSDVDQHEAREVGEKAAQYALWNNVDGSIVIKRTGHYSVNYELVDLAEIAGKTKYMPDNFINPAGNHVTDAFRYYVQPLVGSNMPVARRLKAPMAPKILKR